MKRSIVLICFWLWLTLVGAQVAAQEHLQPLNEKLTYRKAWALVVGINYSNRKSTDPQLTPLHNAESDALSFAKTLESFAGYSPQTVQLVLGENAQRATLEDLLGSRFLLAKEVVDGRQQSRIQTDDSLVVFFSGHGIREPGSGEDEFVGYLCPYDTEFETSGELRTSSALEYGRLLELLRRCPARHKLLIVDACFSGQIFQIAQRQRTSKASEFDYFKAPALQVITASRAFEQASDSDDLSKSDLRNEARAVHSPFMEVLLSSLEKPPTAVPVEPFAVSQLFPILTREVPKRSVFGQEPVSGWLQGQGDFFFIPAGSSGLARPAVGSFVLQTLPGLKGGSWFDEIPWFVPRVRFMMEQEEAGTIGREDASPNDPDTARFYTDLRKRAGQLAVRIQKDDFQLGMKLSLLASAGTNRQEMAIAELTSLLQERASLDGGLEAEECHLLAILQDRLAHDAAEKSFEQALKGYLTKGDSHRGLLALCYGDFSRWALRTGDSGRAYALSAASEVALQPEKSSPYFAISKLTADAYAKRREGEWNVVNEALSGAIKIGEEHLRPGHPMRAYVHERMAWGLMDQWRVREAKKNFEAALQIRQPLADEDYESFIGTMHNQHGIAMANRFAGKTEAARKQYAGQRSEIIQRLNKNIDNWTQLQVYGLYERLLNTTERLADCYLFAEEKDIERSLQLYSEASGYIKNLSPASRATGECRIAFKQCIANAINGKIIDAKAALSIAALVDLTEKQREDQKLLAGLALSVVKIQDHEVENGCVQLRQMVRGELKRAQGDELRRDDREILLFAMMFVLATHRERASELNLAADSRLLISLLPHSFDQPVLRYLRQYYDTAIDAASLTKNPDFRELAQWMRKSKTGEREYSLPDDRSTLLFHFTAERGWALLYVPEASAMVVPLPFGLTQLNQIPSPQLNLPEQLSEALQQVDDSVEILWSDPVVNLHTNYPFTQPAKRTISDIDRQTP